MSVKELSSNFSSYIHSISQPVVIEFYASWCPKCAMMQSVYEHIAVYFYPQIYFYKIDIDTIPEQVTGLGIDVFPTFIVYHNGKILGYTSGVLSENILKKRIAELTHIKMR